MKSEITREHGAFRFEFGILNLVLVSDLGFSFSNL